MNPPTDANQHPDIGLSASELAALVDVCQRTLARRPELAGWLRHVAVGRGLTLPFIPIRCFRLMSVSHYPDEALGSALMHVFRSSGSTQAVRATHYLGPAGWASYKKASVEGFHDACSRLGIPARSKIISLVPPREQWPESSLAAMLALWKESGLDVHHMDVETSPDSLRDYFRLQESAVESESYIIFGTSLHLLSVVQWHTDSRGGAGRPFINGKRIAIFDTGGSKGRTVHIGTDQLHQLIKGWVSNETKLTLVSEYGMCELTSQAYTAQSPHGNVFQCSPTLRSLIIQANLLKLCPSGEDGFLAFVDLANIDSWPCIITEDIGRSVHQSTRMFALQGRAPDATVKGCSLNVKTNFRFDLSRLIEDAKDGTPAQAEVEAAKVNGIRADRKISQRMLFDPEHLLQALTDPVWDGRFRKDLHESMQEWNQPVREQSLLTKRELSGETLAIIASANIPITWLFPAAHAWLMDARGVDIFLPSVRQDDPISDLVRKQIITLANAFNRCTQADFLRIYSNRFSDKNAADRVLIFGHDETIRSIASHLQPHAGNKRIIGLGHFRNKFSLNSRSDLNSLAELCTAWLGRGCLTPIVAEVPDSWERNELSDVTATLAAALDSAFKANESLHTKTLQFAHRQNIAELRAVAYTHQLELFVKDETDYGVTCAIMPGTNPEALLQTGLCQKLLDWSGCGWLNIAKQSVCNRLWPTLGHESVLPKLWDKHQGKTWNSWLTENQQASEN